MIISELLKTSSFYETLTILQWSKRFDLVCSFDLVNLLTPYNNSWIFTSYACCEYCIMEMNFGRYYFEDDTQQEI